MSPEQARGQSGRQARGHLGFRVRALRNADRAHRVPRRDGVRPHRGDPRTRARLERGSGVDAIQRPAAAQTLPRKRSEASTARHRRCADRDRRTRSAPTSAEPTSRDVDACRIGPLPRLAVIGVAALASWIAWSRGGAGRPRAARPLRGSSSSRRPRPRSPGGALRHLARRKPGGASGDGDGPVRMYMHRLDHV